MGIKFSERYSVDRKGASCKFLEHNGFASHHYMELSDVLAALRQPECQPPCKLHKGEEMWTAKLFTAFVDMWFPMLHLTAYSAQSGGKQGVSILGKSQALQPEWAVKPSL